MLFLINSLLISELISSGFKCLYNKGIEPTEKHQSLVSIVEKNPELSKSEL